MAEPVDDVERSDIELIDYALATNDEDDSTYWDIVIEFQKRGTRTILAKMLELCDSNDESKQRFGLSVLAQLGYKTGETFVEESLPTVIRLCQESSSPDVLQCGITALGHFRDPRGLTTVLRNLHHPNEWVRHDVALTLPNVAGDPTDPEVIDALIALTVDESALVRDWATFGLGTTLHADSPEIRLALWLRVDDEDPETVFEALRGLGARHVPGVIDRVVEVLNRRPVSSYFIGASVEMPDRRLVEPLEAILAMGMDDEDISAGWLGEVIADCANVTFLEYR
jgi:HEAT repeat protein